MLITVLRRLAAPGFLVLFFVAATYAQSVDGPQGGSYQIGSSGDLITSLSNDDGSVVQYQYDAAGVEIGMTVSIGTGVSLPLNYSVNEDGTGWLQAGALPPLMWSSDAYGRTESAALYPGMTLVGGEWYVDLDTPAPIPVASFNYGPGGHLAAVTLDNGLALQLGAPTAGGVVPQSLILPNGTVAATASPVGGTNGVKVVPAQLDAIAARFGLGGDWAETMTFTLAASGHVTVGRNATTILLYLVDAGPFRVGFDPEGNALFYDFVPSYTTGELNDPSTEVAGVAPSHIVMTADGAAGVYTDQPAYGALYSAWTETNASGVPETRFATLEPPSSSSLRVAANGRFRAKSDMYVLRYRTVVCAGGQCWHTYYYEWVDDPVYSVGDGPSSTYGDPPARGGRAPAKTGNQVQGDPKLKALVDRGLNQAKAKLQKPACVALFDKLGVENKKLIDLMNERGYSDPTAYLTNYLTYVVGAAKDCKGSPAASTTVRGSRVAICRSFHNATDSKAGVYLIHEMMHTLGYGESPMTGFPTSAQITSMVETACGN